MTYSDLGLIEMARAFKDGGIEEAAEQLPVTEWTRITEDESTWPKRFQLVIHHEDEGTFIRSIHPHHLRGEEGVRPRIWMGTYWKPLEAIGPLPGEAA